MKFPSRSPGLELRHSTDDFVNHRRVAASLALVSMGSLAVVALYQLGVLKRLPEPPFPVWMWRRSTGPSRLTSS